MNKTIKIIFIFILLIGFIAFEYYYLNYEPEEMVYTDNDFVIGFVKVTDNDLPYTKSGTGDDTMKLEGVRLFTEEFRDQDMASAGGCSDTRIANGGYEISVLTVKDYTNSSAVDMSRIVKRVEESGADVVKMITVQDIPFIYSQGDAYSCGYYASIEGVTTSDSKVVITMFYYREEALENFDAFINSLEFQNI